MLEAALLGALSQSSLILSGLALLPPRSGISPPRRSVQPEAGRQRSPPAACWRC